MSLERDGPDPGLEDDVRALLLELGWEEGDPGEFSRGLHRTTYRASLGDSLGYARTHGLDALERLLRREGENLERDSERNRFRERGLARLLREEFEELPPGRRRTGPRRST